MPATVPGGSDGTRPAQRPHQLAPYAPHPPQRGGKIRSRSDTSGRDEQLVARLDGMPPDRADWQLRDLVGAPDERDDPNPRQQPLVGLEDRSLLVDRSEEHTSELQS